MGWAVCGSSSLRPKWELTSDQLYGKLNLSQGCHLLMQVFSTGLTVNTAKDLPHNGPSALRDQLLLRMTVSNRFYSGLGKIRFADKTDGFADFAFSLGEN